MLETEVDEEVVGAAARADSDRPGEAGHDLKTAREIEGATDAGTQEPAVLPRDLVRTGHRLAAGPDTLQHEVDPRRGQPDHARPRGDAGRRRPLAGEAPRARRNRQ